MDCREMYMKRGQVTIFVLLGILLLFFVGFFYVFMQNLTNPIVEESPVAASVRTYLDACFENEASYIIDYVALQGGYYSQPPYPFTYTFDGENYQIYKPYIPIYFSDNEAHVPTIEEMESAISEGVVAFADPCLNFSSFPYEIEKGEMTVASKLSESSADITINLPLTITDNNEIYTIDALNINVPTNILSLYATAQLMTGQQYVDTNKVCVTCLARIGEENKLNINSEEFATEDTYNVLYKLQDIDEKGPVFSFMYIFVFPEQASSLNLLSIPNQEAIIGYTFTYTAFASGENVQYQDDSDLFDIDVDTGVISFVPTKEDMGTFIITITAKDELNQTDEQSFVLTIKNVVSSDLSVEPLPYFTANVGNPFEYKINATSNYTVYFSDDTDLFDIDSKTGKIKFTPAESDIGEHDFNITITDAIGNYQVEEGSIYVVKG